MVFRPSSDFQIRSFCDEILVFNGTSIHDVLSDWCDVLSYNSNSEETVILLVNKSSTSSQAATQQRTELSVQKWSELSVESLAMFVLGGEYGFCGTELIMLRAAMGCHGSSERIKLRCRGRNSSLPMTFPHAKLNEFLM